MKIESLNIPKESEDKLWELVELAHWPCNVDKTKIMYLKKLSEEECEQFRKLVSKAFGLLDRTISDNEQISDNLGVGDDGYSDLIYHIVGLGREQYYKHLNNLKLVEKLANSSKYVESFSYCLPYKDDYGKDNRYTIEHIIKIAKESIKEIELFEKMDDGAGCLKEIQGHMNFIKHIFELFLDNKGVPCYESVIEDLLISNKGSISDSCRKIDKFFEKNYLELPRKFTDPRNDGSDFHGMCTAIFTNTIGDAETLLEFTKE